MLVKFRSLRMKLPGVISLVKITVELLSAPLRVSVVVPEETGVVLHPELVPPEKVFVPEVLELV